MSGNSNQVTPRAKWGIVAEWDELGLHCCGWMQRTNKTTGTMDDPKEFKTEAAAVKFIEGLQESPCDRTLTPQEFAP